MDVRWRETTPLLSLKALREAPELATMGVLQKGSRLSITPVTPAEWQAVLKRLRAA